jgi:antirestriction protein ArdC
MPLDAQTRARRKRAFTPDPAKRRDIAQEITDRIIALLEGGALPWRMPWTRAGGALPLRHEGSPYRGINVFLLGLSAMGKGYVSPYWMSYRQAAALGAQVRKGEKASTVVYYGVARARMEGAGGPPAPDRGDNDNGADPGPGGHRRFIKWYPAFNADQIDGLPARYHPVRDDLDGGARPIAALAAIADAMIAGLGVDYVEGGDSACYIRALDQIRMPAITRFHDGERYYATKFHECAHAVEHPKRLAMDYGGPKSFGNEPYARAEIVAEMAAAMLGATLGFRPDHLTDHAAYIQSWLAALRGDKRFILKAAAEAQRSADHLLAAAGLGGPGPGGAEDVGDEPTG